MSSSCMGRDGEISFGFENQYTMKVGQALERSGVSFASFRGGRCPVGHYRGRIDDALASCDLRRGRTPSQLPPPAARNHEPDARPARAPPRCAVGGRRRGIVRRAREAGRRRSRRAWPRRPGRRSSGPGREHAETHSSNSFVPASRGCLVALAGGFRGRADHGEDDGDQAKHAEFAVGARPGAFAML